MDSSKVSSTPSAVISAPAMYAFNSLKLACSRDGQRLVTIDSTHKPTVWDTATGNPIDTFYHLSFPNVRCMSISPDGTKIAMGSLHWILVCDAESFVTLHTLKNDGRVTFLTFSPDSRQIASSSEDYMIRIWDVDKGNVVHCLVRQPIWAWIAFSPDGTAFVTGGDGPVKLWDAKTGSRIKKYDFRCESAEFGPDGKQIVSIYNAEMNVRIWDVSTGGTFVTLKKTNLEDHFQAAIFSPDGQRIVTGSDGQTFRGAEVWNAQNGMLLRVLYTQDDVDFLHYSNNGRKIITGGGNYKIMVWDTPEWDFHWTPKNHKFLKGRTGHRILKTFFLGVLRLCNAKDYPLSRVDPACIEMEILSGLLYGDFL